MWRSCAGGALAFESVEDAVEAHFPRRAVDLKHMCSLMHAVSIISDWLHLDASAYPHTCCVHHQLLVASTYSCLVE
jgi:hypothetical protein